MKFDQVWEPPGTNPPNPAPAPAPVSLEPLVLPQRPAPLRKAHRMGRRTSRVRSGCGYPDARSRGTKLEQNTTFIYWIWVSGSELIAPRDSLGACGHIKVTCSPGTRDHFPPCHSSGNRTVWEIRRPADFLPIGIVSLPIVLVSTTLKDFQS